jgi:outer membrane protein assembly factor BamD
MKRFSCVLSLLLLVGCAGSDAAKSKLPRTYSNTARQLYEEAMRAYQKGNYQEAISGFTLVKRRFPFSEFAPLSDLRIADTQFKREQFLEAIDGYKLFIKFRPTNENVPYAQYMIARSYLSQGPEDWWFLPPAYEKDLSPVQDAVKEVRKFLKQYPGSGLVPKARELLKQCERKLADYELYVARFYADRGKWMAASMRLSYIVEQFETLATDEEVLFLLGNAYVRLRQKDKAKVVFAKLSSTHPQTRHRDEVERALKNLEK